MPAINRLPSTPALPLATLDGDGLGDACEACPVDFSNDDMVNGADLGLLLGSWGPCLGCRADLTGDDVVNGADLGHMLGAWGACPS